MRYDPKTHHHRSIRLKGYDYTLPGTYFVTLVTHRRDPVFGEVSGGEMKLSALGQIVLDEWMRSIGIRKEIQLHEDEFVVMPNHSHGIVWMVGVTGVVGAYGIRPGIHPGIHPEEEEEGVCHTPQPKDQPLRRIPKSLGAFIGGVKASVTSRAGSKLNMSGIWQPNYYEHIIRNETEFETIWNYIDNNPRQWEQDQLNPIAPDNPFNQE